jgi:hypothetical protein
VKRGSAGRRLPDSWASPHERARVRLAERMDEPLDPAESAWLEAHLAGCSACREIDTEYRNDRALLRAMRVVPPPRDLWARTSAALDMEQDASRSRRRRRTRRRAGLSVVAFPRRGWAPIGALGSIAAVLVVGFLLGNMLIAGPTAPSHVIAQGASATPNLVPTPINVPPGDVAWVDTNSDGSIVLRQAPVSDVCPNDAQAGCVPIDRNASNVATLSVKPKSVHQSATSGQMVIIGQGSGPAGLSLFIVNVGKAPAPTPTPSVGATSPTTSSPSTTAATGSPALATPASNSPTASVGPTPQTSATPKPTATASIVANVTPAPSAASIIALASDVGVLNAETAAFSPDGAWFAFTARPLKQDAGSDIYLWHVGDGHATRVTTDRRSVFAGWVAGRLVGSRADGPTTGSGAATSAPPASGTSAAASDASAPLATSTASAPTAAPSSAAEFGATSFLIDPTTLGRTSIGTPLWRPSIDPTGHFVVYWEGTVEVDPTSGGWRTATGRLVIAAWPAVASAAPAASGSPSAVPASPSVAPGASASAEASPAPTSKPKGKPKSSPSSPAGPGATASPASSAAASNASSTPSSSPSPAASVAAAVGLPADIASAADVDWAVAWDETGTHLAVWIEDRGDPTFGHLDLLTIGGSAGLPAVGSAQVSDEPALPGFSLAEGHLAWATPAGVNANGSQLKIFAYSGKGAGIGSRQGQPGSGSVIVVQP